MWIERHARAALRRLCGVGRRARGRRRVLFLSAVIAAAAATPLSAGTKIIRISTAEELESLLSKPLRDVEIRLAPGEYHLTPADDVDATCGNCEDPNTPVPITVGLQISGHNVKIVGPRDHSAVVYTHAGYGVYFKDCVECEIQNLSITGGERDPDPNATDAAVVIKGGRASVFNCRIFDNIGDSTLVAKNVVGIIGVCVRENAHAWIRNNRITRNSWDGVAMYRDAQATIMGNVIDGVDKARGQTVGGGRGVGIGITWNAEAFVAHNLVRRYWKGIGVFVDASARIAHNIVEDVLTWGIALWDADKGEPRGNIYDNIVYLTGACGVSITRSAPIDRGDGGPHRFVRNIIVKTAQNPKYDDPEYYCFQCALALHAVPEGFTIEDNLFFDNRRASEDLPDYDVGRGEFERRIEKRTFNSMWLRESTFFETYLLEKRTKVKKAKR